MTSRSRVDIRDPAILGDLRNALIQFTPEALEALRATERQLQVTQEWLVERQGYWERQIRYWEHEVAEAQRALSRCQSARRRDEYANCTVEENRLRTAQYQLGSAKQNLATVRQWQRELQRAIEQYKRQASRLRQHLENTSKRAQAYLSERQTSLEAYLAAQVGFTAIGSLFFPLTKNYYSYARNQVGQQAVRAAKRDEIQLVQRTGIGTRPWAKSELKQLQKGRFPGGYQYQGHHINNVARFPDLAGIPDNIKFVTRPEHKTLHQGNWHNNTSGKMFNRKSLAVQWLKHKNSG